MPLVAANVGERFLLDAMLAAQNTHLHLYKTDVTPTASSTVASFTEADFTGYSVKTLTGANWNDATTVSGKATATYADQSWTNSGSSQTVYGYFITDDTDDTLLWAEKFDSARVLGTSDVVNITPMITLNSEN